MIKKRLSILLMISVITASLLGCEKKSVSSAENYGFTEGPLVTTTETSTSQKPTPSVSTETSVSVGDTSISEEQIETIDYQLLIVNRCNADIEMVAILDPVTEEQINIGKLENGKVLSFSFTEWPKDKTTADVAFYNNLGEFVSSSEINISGVKNKVTLMLSGDGYIDKVEGIVD